MASQGFPARGIMKKDADGAGRRLAAKPIKLVGLADYQAGAIVSRTLVDRKTGTVTFFAFDRGQGLSEHTAPFDALVHLLEDDAEVTISGKAYHVQAGEMIILPAGEPHALRATNRFKMLLIMIR